MRIFLVLFFLLPFLVKYFPFLRVVVGWLLREVLSVFTMNLRMTRPQLDTTTLSHLYSIFILKYLFMRTRFTPHLINFLVSAIHMFSFYTPMLFLYTRIFISFVLFCVLILLVIVYALRRTININLTWLLHPFLPFPCVCK